MPTLTQKPEYAYVDVPCAALPYRFYSKIFRHIAHSYIDRLVYQKDYHHEKYLWVATEKVKGFSMSMVTDGINISVGSRSEILTTKEHYDKFPEWFGVFQPYFAKLLQTFKYCNEKHFPGPRSLQVFVELFGGEYPHKDVEPIPYNKPIVREDPVYYAPDYHLYAFDVYINGDFIPFNQTLDILESNDWLHAKVLAAGTFEEIMNFDVDNLKSFIPASFNLPPKEGNIAEGIVLRMLHHTRRFKKKRDIHGLKCAEPRKVEYFTQKQERLLKIGRGFFTVGRLFENLQNQAPEHVELWAKTYPSRLVGRLLADGCKRFRTEYQEEIRDAWIKKRVPFGRYFKPHVQKVVEAYIKAFQDGSDISGESSNDSGDSRSQQGPCIQPFFRQCFFTNHFHFYFYHASSFSNIYENKTKTPPPRIIIKLDSKMNTNMDIISSLEIERIEHIFKTCLLQFGNNSKANPFLILLPKTLCFQQLLRSYSFFAQRYKSDGCVFRFQLYMKHQLRLLSL